MRTGTALGVFVALLLAPSTALAVTRTVCPTGCDHTTIAAALAASVGGDVVRVTDGGTYTGPFSVPPGVRLESAMPGVTTLTSTTGTLVTFTGADGAVAGFRLAGTPARLFSTASAATISDVSANGLSLSTDGAILFTNATATVRLERSTFAGIRTSGGALIRSDRGRVELDTVRITNSGATYVVNADGTANLAITGLDVDVQTGQGLRFSSMGGIELSGSRFASCLGGGARIALLGIGNAVLDGVTFDANTATDGGGLYFDGVPGRLTRMSNVSFVGNRTTGATATGGGLRVTDGTVELVDASFTGNATSGVGSAIAVSGSASSVTVVRGAFCENTETSSGSGSVVRIDQGTLVVRASLFGGNGGFAIEGQTGVSSITVDHSVFLHNEGGIFRRTTLALTNSVLAFTTPYASVSGLVSSGTTTIENDLFFSNATDPTGLSATNVVGRDPGYFSVDAAMPCASDLRVRTTSPLRDAGRGAADVDATTADIGLHGGADSAASWWTDADSDGSPYVYDCAPTNVAIRPGRTELCNGIDDDCDLAADEGLMLGATCTSGSGTCARTGTNVCGSGGAVVCSATPGTPSAELCGSGADEDCDAATDEGFSTVGMACSAGLGACARSGTFACSTDRLSTVCGAVPGTPGTELCGSGADEDCDASTDEGFPTVGTSCSAGVGECARSGTEVCSASGLSTTCDAIPGAPASETCDGDDEDCDGTSDDGPICAADPAGSRCLLAGTSMARCGCSSDADCAGGLVCDATGLCTAPAIDGGAPSDAGVATDAGLEPSDAGVVDPDAAVDTDAAMDLDAGTAVDAGTSELDASTADGGAMLDAALPLDAPGLDAPPSPDAIGFGDAGPAVASSGCACHLAGRARPPSAALVTIGLLGLVATRRRRRAIRCAA